MNPLMQGSYDQGTSEADRLTHIKVNDSKTLTRASNSNVMKEFYKENFRYTNWRWLVIFVIAFSCLGCNFCYGIITA